MVCPSSGSWALDMNAYLPGCKQAQTTDCIFVVKCGFTYLNCKK